MRFIILYFFVYVLHLDARQDLLHKLYFSIICCIGHRIIEMNNNSPPLTFKRFQTIVSRLELPRRPLPPITQQQMDKCCTKIADNHDQLYNIPSLEELGIHYCFYLCSICFVVLLVYWEQMWLYLLITVSYDLINNSTLYIAEHSVSTIQ